MKKVLALVLAVMMLCTMAFAVVTNPGASDNTSNSKTWLPGETIKVNDSGIINKNPGDQWTPATVKSINSTNYSISNLKYQDGKNLVESVKFNDANDRVDIKLKQDYTKTTTSTLDMTFTLKGKKVGKNAKPDNIDIRIYGSVGYKLEEKNLLIQPDESVIVTSAVSSQDGKTVSNVNNTSAFATGDGLLWKVGKATGATTDYGDLEFTAADGDTDIEVRVYKDDKLYLYNDTDADGDVLKAYADTDADITFLNFPGAPTFNATAKVYFYKEEGSYVYGVKDGKLTEINAKWSDDDGAFVLKTRTLGNYVFSDKKLSVAAPSAGSNNPDTGANDVVGIATALAAVALVSAAAVSLKK